MPNTKAGKRLLAARRAGLPHWDDGIRWSLTIDAIEAEALVSDEALRLIRENGDARVAAEKARIRAAVEDWSYGGTNLCRSCYMPRGRHDVDCRTLSVLAIIDGESTDA